MRIVFPLSTAKSHLLFGVPYQARSGLGWHKAHNARTSGARNAPILSTISYNNCLIYMYHYVQTYSSFHHQDLPFCRTSSACPTFFCWRVYRVQLICILLYLACILLLSNKRNCETIRRNITMKIMDNDGECLVVKINVTFSLMIMQHWSLRYIPTFTLFYSNLNSHLVVYNVLLA